MACLRQVSSYTKIDDCMELGEEIRQNIFWTIDFFQGSKIRKNYNEIKLILYNSDNHDVSNLIKDNIKKLLSHAVTTTPFYLQYSDFHSLEDFPVINKTIIRENQSAFLSSKFVEKELHKVITSGSTGAPFIVLQDSGKRNRHKAENILFSEMAGHNLGSRLYYLRVWNSINKKNWLTQKIQNIIPFNIYNLSEKSITELLDRLSKDTSKKSVLAFSSTLEELSRFLQSNPYNAPIRIKSIITMSETLPEGAKQILAEVFGCPVISRYSNMENGFLAQQCLEDNEYHINTASFYIEMLKENLDEPVPEGEIGRIVVTDLFNYAMPLIRYDTGDMAVLSKKSKCGRVGPVFSNVDGRKVDFILDTEGNLLSPHVITNTMWKFASEIKQFQFIQNGQAQYLLKLNCPEKQFNGINELTKDLYTYLGHDANIQIELIDEIPLLSSGKRKKIVNNYTKKLKYANLKNSS